MSRADLFQLVQIVYWLALSTWFGGVLFVAMAAPVIFRTVRENNPVLPHVLSVNLEGQHGTLLAGSIVGSLLARLAWVQLACGGIIVADDIGTVAVLGLDVAPWVGCDLAGVIDGRSRQQYGEFVTAQSSDRVGVAQHAAQAFTKLF